MPEHQVGDELAEHDLEPADGRGEELLHRAALPLARDGEGGEQHRGDGEEVGGEPGDHVERGAARRVVAGPDLHLRSALRARPGRARRAAGSRRGRARRPSRAPGSRRGTSAPSTSSCSGIRSRRATASRVAVGHHQHRDRLAAPEERSARRPRPSRPRAKLARRGERCDERARGLGAVAVGHARCGMRSRSKATP